MIEAIIWQGAAGVSSSEATGSDGVAIIGAEEVGSAVTVTFGSAVTVT